MGAAASTPGDVCVDSLLCVANKQPPVNLGSAQAASGAAAASSTQPAYVVRSSLTLRRPWRVASRWHCPGCELVFD